MSALRTLFHINMQIVLLWLVFDAVWFVCLFAHWSVRFAVRPSVRSCVRACVRMCVRVRACVRACV